MKHTNLIINYRTPLLAGAALVALEMLVAACFLLSAPPGQRWLGNNILFPNDTAVYLSYLEQGSQGRINLSNLYAIEPHSRRLDSFWSALGIASRLGIPTLVTHEVARWLATIFLAFAIFFAVRRIPGIGKNAAFVTWVAIFGVGLGWLYTLGIYAFGTWNIDTRIAADVGTDFSVFPLLFCGPHMILSLGLLLFSLNLSWDGITKVNQKSCILAALVSAALFSFHPYFVPLVTIFWLIALIFCAKKIERRLLVCVGILALALVPATIIYLPLYFDPTFRIHHLEINTLPLAPALSWAFTLAPFSLALAWQRRNPTSDESADWVLAWMTTALICLILPFPWKRKFLAGGGVWLVIMTWRFWVWIKDAVLAKSFPWQRGWLAGIVVLGLGLSSFQLLISQIKWSTDPARAKWFYRPDELFMAWDEIKLNSGSGTIVVTDDFWTNNFTPAYTGRRVLIGHDHETPRYDEKIKSWKSNFINGDANQGLAYLNSNQITHLILTLPDMRDRLTEPLQNTGWIKSLSNESVDLWTAPGI